MNAFQVDVIVFLYLFVIHALALPLCLFAVHYAEKMLWKDNN